MPCNSDHMAANGYERELSRVACLLDELAGKKFERRWWSGYHPSVYGKANRALGDKMVSELCKALQSRDVTQCSLEMQIWWRDHQAADKARCERERAKEKYDVARAAALEKLTPAERWLLNIK